MSTNYNYLINLITIHLISHFDIDKLYTIVTIYYVCVQSLQHHRKYYQKWESLTRIGLDFVRASHMSNGIICSQTNTKLSQNNHC